MHAAHQSFLCVDHDQQARKSLFAKMPMSKSKVKNMRLAIGYIPLRDFETSCNLDAAMHEPSQT